MSPIFRVSGLHLEPDLSNYGCPARKVHEKQHPSEASHHLILDHLILLEQALLRNVETLQDPKEEYRVGYGQSEAHSETGPHRELYGLAQVDCYQINRVAHEVQDT